MNDDIDDTDDYEVNYRAGALAYRERVRTILESPEAKGRRDAAMYFALETDMTAEEAIGALAAIPKISSIDARQEGVVVSDTAH